MCEWGAAKKGSVNERFNGEREKERKTEREREKKGMQRGSVER